MREETIMKKDLIRKSKKLWHTPVIQKLDQNDIESGGTNNPDESNYGNPPQAS